MITIPTYTSENRGCVDVSPERFLRKFTRMNPHKGLGPDGIPASLLKAGGFALALHASQLAQRIVNEEIWPTSFKGGRLVDLFKGKGNKQDCDASRGLLIGDHLAKATISCVKDALETPYRANMPSSQFGAVGGGGTDFVHHFVLTCLDYAAVFTLGIFVLFVDLIKAFDKILRELVFGFPQGHEASRVACLESFGLALAEAEWIVNFIDENGTAFSQWGLDPKLSSLVCGLHSRAWASYGECGTYIVSTTGGRQGCLLGAMVFNAAYALALRALHARLLEANIVLKVWSCNGPFWYPDWTGSDHVDDNVIDAVFVDDEAVVFIARTPRLLQRAIKILLDVLPETFQRRSGVSSLR